VGLDLLFQGQKMTFKPYPANVTGNTQFPRCFMAFELNNPFMVADNESPSHRSVLCRL
jgi:hypothetical protein